MNKVITTPNVTKDPVIGRKDDGTITFARFGGAVNRRFAKEGEQSADFLNYVAFGKTAEFVEKYVKKGTKLIIEGRLQTGSYTNKDGQKVYSTDIVVENLEFRESKAKAEEKNDGAAGAAGAAASTGDEFVPMPEGMEEELPFN